MPEVEEKKPGQETPPPEQEPSVEPPKAKLSFIRAGKFAKDEEIKAPELSEEEVLSTTSRSFGSLRDRSDSIFKPKEEEPGTEETPPAETPPETPPEEPKSKPSLPLEVVKGRSEVRTATPPPVEKPKPPAPPVEKDELEGLADLPQDARDSVQFFVQAAKVDPKYKGMAKKQLEFIRADIEKRRELEDDETFDGDFENHEGYRKFTNRMKPDVSPAEVRRLEREIIKMEAREEARKENAAIQERLDRQEREKTMAPVIRQEVVKFGDGIRDFWMEQEETKPVMEHFMSKVNEGASIEEAFADTKTAFPFEAEIFQHAQVGSELVNALLRIRNGIDPFDGRNPTHRLLADKIPQWEERMATSPALAEQRVRGGKTFLPLDEYNKLSDSEKQNHWVFDTDDFVHYIKREVEIQSTRHAKDIQEKVKAYRKAETPAPKPPEKPSAETPPAQSQPTPRSRVPGPSKTTPAKTTTNNFFKTGIVKRG